MIAVKELKRWLDTLATDDFVFIDEDGMALESVCDRCAYLEIGGEPEEED